MKDKETKENIYKLFKVALNQAVSGEEMRDGEKDGLEELVKYVFQIEQEAERRGWGKALNAVYRRTYISNQDVALMCKVMLENTKLLEEENEIERGQ